MDEARYTQGIQAYETGDMRVAAREFLAATDGRADGPAYHQAGNALMKLRRYADAATVYAKALNDESYQKVAAVNCNMGAALSAEGRFDEAVRAYSAALEDAEYPAPYKALQGLGGALYKMGRMPEAAEAYRRAALDDTNPDPGKALNNLGLAFMALGRPQDAVEAYRAAIDMDGYTGRGKAAGNLGMAYVAMGMHELAVRAFARATDDLGYELGEAALAAREASIAALEPTRETVEGWSTGELPPVIESPAIESEPSAAAEEDAEGIESAFFTRTDADMKVADREARKTERTKKRSERSIWVLTAAWGLAGILVVGGLAFAWLGGLGYPTQAMTVNGMLEAHRDGQAVEKFWVAVPKGDVEKEMGTLPPQFTDYYLGDIERSAKTSKVEVTIMLEQGAPLAYQVLMVREGVGWKVNGVTNDWRSTGGGS